MYIVLNWDKLQVDLDIVGRIPSLDTLVERSLEGDQAFHPACIWLVGG